MLLEAEAGDGELPRAFVAPLVPAARLAAAPAGSTLEAFASEVDGEAADVGFAEAEPVVGRAPALAQAVREARSGRQTLVLASEQRQRVDALLNDAGAGPAPEEADLDLDFDL